MRMLKNHKDFLRLFDDNQMENMSREDTISELERINEFCEKDYSLTTEDLKKKFKTFNRKRHFIFWHDGSTISNHSHILMMVTCLYDKALFLSNSEYKVINSRDVDVQAAVERPYLYILARCPSSDEQIMYIDTRLEDVKKLAKPIKTESGIVIHDEMRFFKGDGPAVQFETGQQKGGLFFCWGCGVKATRTIDLTHVYNNPYISMQERNKIVLKTTGSQSRSRRKILKLYSNLDKVDIVQELHQREITFCHNKTKKELEQKLTQEMCGIQRVPAMFYNEPESSYDNINLPHYQALLTEPLHDVTGHTKNLYQELGHHVSKADKILLEMTISTSFDGKDSKRGADYRLSLLKVTLSLKDRLHNTTVRNILKTHCEVQQLLYSSEHNRSVEAILRLYNQSFLHALLLKDYIGYNVKSMTERKLYGKYFHALSRHASEQYRIISGIASNTEAEERTFNFLKTASALTSNHHPDHVILNSFLRLQAHDKLNEDRKESINSEKETNKVAASLKIGIDNTVISFHLIEKYPYEYQSHLERIADYIADEKTKFWKEVTNGIMFFDSVSCKSPKLPPHFRSTTLRNELDHVSRCWENVCVLQNNLIPAVKIKLEETDGKTKIVNLDTLQKFACKNVSEIEEVQIEDKENRDKIIELSMSMNKSADESFGFTSNDPVQTSTPCQNRTLPNRQVDRNIHDTNEINKLELTEKATEIISVQPILEFDLLSDNSEKQIATYKPKSKCGALVMRILGLSDEVIAYDKARVAVKENSTNFRINCFKDISARIEVKLVVENDLLKKKLKEIELVAMKESVSPIPKNNEEYNDILLKLKMIRSLLGTHFKV